MKALPIIALFLVALNSCEERKNEPLHTSRVHVQSVDIPSHVAFGQPITFEVTCTTPTPCWEFDTFEIKRDGHEHEVQVVARSDDRPCIQILGSFKATGSVTPTERGTYTFKFWRAQAPSLDVDVIVQ